MMLRGTTGITALRLSLLLGLCRCAADECGGNAPASSSVAPLILSMEVAPSIEQDPWRVILATAFADQDGDLSSGKAYLYANRETTPRTSQDLKDVLEASGGLPSDATFGVLALPLGISPATPDGAHLHLGTQLVDSKQNRSNCYVLDLSFDVKPSSQ